MKYNPFFRLGGYISGKVDTWIDSLVDNIAFDERGEPRSFRGPVDDTLDNLVEKAYDLFRRKNGN